MAAVPTCACRGSAASPAAARTPSTPPPPNVPRGTCEVSGPRDANQPHTHTHTLCFLLLEWNISLGGFWPSRAADCDVTGEVAELAVKVTTRSWGASFVCLTPGFSFFFSLSNEKKTTRNLRYSRQVNSNYSGKKGIERRAWHHVFCVFLKV